MSNFILSPISIGSNVRRLNSNRVSATPCSKLKSCSLHSPALSQFGQSWGWLINNISTPPLRASRTSGDKIFCTSIPSITVVLQEATSFGIGRGSLSEPLETLTKHVRHFPPLPSKDE